jgi:hypothetical protein
MPRRIVLVFAMQGILRPCGLCPEEQQSGFPSMVPSLPRVLRIAFNCFADQSVGVMPFHISPARDQPFACAVILYTLGGVTPKTRTCLYFKLFYAVQVFPAAGLEDTCSLGGSLWVGASAPARTAAAAAAVPPAHPPRTACCHAHPHCTHCCARLAVAFKQ